MSAAVGETVDIVTPAGGESVSEGTILDWSVKVGDQVKEGDTVVEISTDKVDMELPAPASGTITRSSRGRETVTIGQVIARMAAGAPVAERAAPPVEPAEPAEPAARERVRGSQPLRGAAAALARYMERRAGSSYGDIVQDDRGHRARAAP